MSMPTWTIFTAPADQIDTTLLREFMTQQREDRAFQESVTLEFKQKISGLNVVKAIAALANTAGGVVLLGVDEDQPDLDSSPGVRGATMIAVLGQCETSLTPRFTPEIIPVPIPGKDEVVLVIRVEADPARLPVVVGGQVPIRQPGRTAQATHDQILELVARRSQRGSGAQMSSVPTVFTLDQSDGAGETRPDLLVRCATAIYARGDLRLLTLGKAARTELLDALTDSPAGVLARLTVPVSSASRPALTWTDTTRSSRRYAAGLDVADGTAVDRIVVDIRVSGPQVMIAVDYHLRRREPGADRPKVPRSDLLAVLAGMVLTVRSAVTPTVVGWLGGPPARIDEISCWATAASQPLSSSLSMKDVAVSRDVPSWAGVVRSFELSASDPIEDPLESLSDSLTSFYVDLGIEDEAAALAGDLAIAREVIARTR